VKNNILTRLRFFALVLSCPLCLPLLMAHSAAYGASSSFAATGLLAHPEETAGEILLRAHERDANAILLVVAGYSRGLDGFPRELALAAFWAPELLKIGAVEKAALASVVIAQMTPPERQAAPGARLALCDMARQAKEPASALREGGILDLEGVCGAWETEARAGTDRDDSYRQARNFFEENGRILSLARIMRDLCSRPATPEDIQALDKLPDHLTLGWFFAATTHDPTRERPDWKADRLIAFLDSQHRASPEDDAVRFPLMTWGIIPYLSDQLSQNPTQALAAVRRAHAGDMEAVQTMIRCYQEGSSGFIKNQFLATAWMSYGAYRGDSRCQLQLAVSYVLAGFPELGWPWAEIARGAPGEQARNIARILADMMNSRLDDRKRGWAEGTLAQIRSDMQQRAVWEQEKAGPMHAYVVETSPFAPTGLLDSADESAGQILLRAHQLDLEAMALVVAGYSRGAGGFPKEPLLAAAWADMVEELGALEAACYVQLVYWADRAADGADSTSKKTLAEYCEPLYENALPDRLRQSGLCDFEQICGQSAERSALSFFAGSVSDTRKKSRQQRESMRLVRELRSRTASQEDCKRLGVFSEVMWVFFIATTHEPSFEPPDWNAERLVDFVNTQNKFLPGSIPLESQSEGQAQGCAPMDTLLFNVNMAIIKRLGENPAAALDVIDRAHKGDPGAAHSMIRYYREGSFGFNGLYLAEPWMRFAALRGDSLAQLLLAVSEFENGRLGKALAWVKLVMQGNDTAQQRLAADLKARLEARSREFHQERSRRDFEELQREIRQRESW
jgi:hypothetical protein